MRVAYGAVIFLGALLLFGVEPMAAKQLLPEMGGSSSVWLAALCFFQVALLVGYAYAYRMTGLGEGRGRQVAWGHGLLLLAAAASLVLVHPHRTTGGMEHPMAAVFGALALRVGLPFVLLSATTPLLQVTMARRWGGAVPYRLFALSNCGIATGVCCCIRWRSSRISRCGRREAGGRRDLRCMRGCAGGWCGRASRGRRSVRRGRRRGTTDRVRAAASRRLWRTSSRLP